MKVKLNDRQIETIRRGLKESERRNYKTDDVSDVFRMLQYWAKSIGAGEAKIQSVADLGGGYLCRVNSKFRDRMKTYLKDARAQGIEKYRLAEKEKEMQENAEKYERLIREAERTRGAD